MDRQADNMRWRLKVIYIPFLSWLYSFGGSFGLVSHSTRVVRTRPHVAPVWSSHCVCSACTSWFVSTYFTSSIPRICCTSLGSKRSKRGEWRKGGDGEGIERGEEGEERWRGRWKEFMHLNSPACQPVIHDSSIATELLVDFPLVLNLEIRAITAGHERADLRLVRLN